MGVCITDAFWATPNSASLLRWIAQVSLNRWGISKLQADSKQDSGESGTSELMNQQRSAGEMGESHCVLILRDWGNSPENQHCEYCDVPDRSLFRNEGFIFPTVRNTIKWQFSVPRPLWGIAPTESCLVPDYSLCQGFCIQWWVIIKHIKNQSLHPNISQLELPMRSSDVSLEINCCWNSSVRLASFPSLVSPFLLPVLIPRDLPISSLHANLLFEETNCLLPGNLGLYQQ